MNIGMIGLGKLGMPVAVAMAYRGHAVMGYDCDPAQMQKTVWPHQEAGPTGEGGFLPYLESSSLTFGALPQVVAQSAIVFVAVQTPHDPQFEGITRLTDERRDFDYGYLENAVGALAEEIARQGAPKIVVIISTMLPGTVRRRLLPLLNPLVKLAYNPSFIAMGTVIRDFLHPEFVLLGIHDEDAAAQVAAFYRTLTGAPIHTTTVENAELIKVAYNTFIGMKIAYANTLMELCHKLPGCDVDAVIDGLALGTRRLLSPAYLRGGMGDGGGCHPRDNIALSWLARETALSFDFFGAMMTARERQTEWLADLARQIAEERHLPIVLMGKAFKAETNITTGSPALLLAHMLHERGIALTHYDPLIDDRPPPFMVPAVFIITTGHQCFRCMPYPQGSVVIDPWRYVEDKPGVEIIRVGGQS